MFLNIMKLDLHFCVSHVQKSRHTRCTDFEIYKCGTKRFFGRGSKDVPMQITSPNLLILLSAVLFGLPDGYFPYRIRRNILCIFLLSPRGTYCHHVVPTCPLCLFQLKLLSSTTTIWRVGVLLFLLMHVFSCKSYNKPTLLRQYGARINVFVQNIYWI
jgi:hypothetical protein